MPTRPLLDDLPAIGLADVIATAGLQTRVDAKYVVDAGTVHRLIDVLADCSVLEIDGRRTFRYRSVYLDTPGLDSYLATARRRPDRCKVRTRAYLDDDRSWVEVKQRDRRGRTVKHRLLIDHPVDGGLGPRERAFVSDLVPSLADRLEPVLTTSYLRSTLVVGASRVTIDRAVRCSTPDGRTALIDGYVVETKSERAGGTVDRALWSLGARPVRISKFAIGLAALRPDLPSNRWHRVIDRHVIVATADA